MWIIALLCEAQAASDGNFLPDNTGIGQRLLSVLGIFIIVGLAWLVSENRKRVSWRPVLWGLSLQFAIGVLFLNPYVSDFFYTVINEGVAKLLSFADEGAKFVFAPFVPHQVLDMDGNPMPVAGMFPTLVNMAFSILPTIVFFSALMSAFYHLGIMQKIVKVIAAIMVKTLGTSGAESLSAAGNIFVGQTEAPLLIRPFVEKMTRSELHAIMTGGFATVAGGVLGAYVGFLQGIPNIAGHLVMASMMAAPAALALSKVMVPETEHSETAGRIENMPSSEATNIVEAVAGGASDGMKLAINVAAMLIAIVALVAMADWMLGVLPIRTCDGSTAFGYACAEGTQVAQAIGMADILSWVFFPLALVMGIPWDEAFVVGRLLGEKIVLTEFIAFGNLGAIINGDTPQLSERSAVMASFALCGFANFASIGIQLGGIGGIAPNRMSDLASLGFRAMCTGALATCLSGTVMGILWMG